MANIYYFVVIGLFDQVKPYYENTKPASRKEGGAEKKPRAKAAAKSSMDQSANAGAAT